MKFQVFSELEYIVPVPTTFIFNLHAARTSHQTVIEETLTIDPVYQCKEFSSANRESRFTQLCVNDKINFKITYSAIVDLHYNKIDPQQLSPAVSVMDLDLDVIQYLYPSRYCQSDKLERLARKEFDHLENEYEKVLAINEWIYNNVEYIGGSTNSGTSAHDTLTERVGVCRDFAHLAIALCRAISIPARYFTAYAYNLFPPDFHACFEAYIGGQWVFFDPTKLVPANGIIKISNGRDAADASVATIFGETTCTSIIVKCESLDPAYKPYYIHNSDPNEKYM
ncbi:transglutaminase family protein [Ferruginibacter lapsinanis]|uniref:transglutaminase-like domain-containing protein n=1 Tax=Ferruginibacter lapsinanis TaxID=563172 RepID=UPI001E40520D|nr:transglutaminase family protein [Ferruginibacter lapsinanis]UEG50807.1 transglutaminase family protein [Ferruginibacter lapsinanis]